MPYNFNIFKSIKKGLMVPNILFPVAYILFSAEVCTRTAKNKSSSHKANPSLLPLAAKPVDQSYKIKGLSQYEANRDALEASHSALEPEVAKSLEGSEGNSADNSVTQPEVAKSLEGSEGNSVDNSVTQPEVAKSLEGFEGNSDALKEYPPNLAHQAQKDGHKSEKDNDAHQVRRCSRPLSKNREGHTVHRFVVPSTKPKKIVRFNQYPEVKIFEVEEEIEELGVETVPARAEKGSSKKLLQASSESSESSGLFPDKSKKSNFFGFSKVRKVVKKMLPKTNKKSPKGQSSFYSDISVDHPSENGRYSNQISQSAELFSQNNENESAGRPLEATTPSNGIVGLDPSRDNRLVDQPIEHDATKESEENRKQWQQLNEALTCLESFIEPSIVDDRSVDQSMEDGTIKDVQEQKLKKDMENMLNDCKIYLSEN